MKSKNARCSIVMATYNGEKYIKEQIDSILINMSNEDELIISDDGSRDNTRQIISQYNDDRIKLIDGPGKGLKPNFINVINEANGKYIILCDQDDVWADNKLEIILQKFKENDVSVVIHDAEIVNEQLELIYPSFFKYRNSGKGIIKNIYKNTYIGCCIAFENSLKKYILPIPNGINVHDQWIGIIGEAKGKGSLFIEDKLIKYRRHDNNFSPMKHFKFSKMIKNRTMFIIRLIERMLKK